MNKNLPPIAYYFQAPFEKTILHKCDYSVYDGIIRGYTESKRFWIKTLRYIKCFRFIYVYSNDRLWDLQRLTAKSESDIVKYCEKSKIVWILQMMVFAIKADQFVLFKTCVENIARYTFYTNNINFALICVIAYAHSYNKPLYARLMQNNLHGKLRYNYKVCSLDSILLMSTATLYLKKKSSSFRPFYIKHLLDGTSIRIYTHKIMDFYNVHDVLSAFNHNEFLTPSQKSYNETIIDKIFSMFSVALGRKCFTTFLSWLRTYNHEGVYKRIDHLSYFIDIPIDQIAIFAHKYHIEKTQKYVLRMFLSIENKDCAEHLINRYYRSACN